MALTTERTSFSLDVPGRYICNTLKEASDSVNVLGGRPFDTIILGGGTFGSVLASHIFEADPSRKHRTLVLEAGPVLFTEHVQNLPMLGTGESWGLPWNSNTDSNWNDGNGLAFAVGGRSLFWGGWSPAFIESELTDPMWPAQVVKDLTGKGGNVSYLDIAAKQIGSDTDNDFVSGLMHEELKKRLLAGLSSYSDAKTTLTGNSGALNPDGLEAPLAIVAKAPSAGFFPMNKFSAMPLLIKSARQAEAEAQGSDARKRLMVVPNCHVIRIETDGKRVTRVHTNQGAIDVPDEGRVFLSLGTIENTRMALHTLPNSHNLIGRNLIAHLRSNLTIRVKRSDFGDALSLAKHPELKDLTVSALFVKGIHEHEDGTLGHFHLQITASGVGETGTDSEAELFKKIPDIDTLDRFAGNTDEFVVITLRGIGEMIGERGPDAMNKIILDDLGPQGPFDYGMSRALVHLEAGPESGKNAILWNVMDDAAETVARMFSASGHIEYLDQGSWQDSPPPKITRRDRLSTTHHEGGTLWMGSDATSSVTDHLGRFWESDNLYALGPCLLPTMGSPNPMLSGVALARRTANNLLSVLITPVEPDYKYLFDGTATTYGKWQAVGGGVFTLQDGQIVCEPAGGEIGLLYYTAEQFEDFTLRLQLKISSPYDNSGVFVRFRDPSKVVSDPFQPGVFYPYKNQAWVGVNTGFEIQIDEQGAPDGRPEHRTGAVYGIPVGTAPGYQSYNGGPRLEPDNWYDMQIEYLKETVRVFIKPIFVHDYGQVVTTFTRPPGAQFANRGNSPTQDADSGFIGLQAHSGRVCFRNVRVGPVSLEARAAFEAVPATAVRQNSKRSAKAM